LLTPTRSFLSLLARPWGIFVLALAVRAGMVLALDLPREIQGDPTWDWAYEQGAVAQAVLRGEGLADPFGQGTGPTAWCGPVYPLVLAAAIHLTGRIGRDTQLLVVGLQVLLSAGIGALLLLFGRAIGRPRLGMLAGIFWAVHPLASYFAIAIVWDSVLVAFGFLAAMTALVRAGPAASPRQLILPGVLLGCVALVNPMPLAVVPAISWYLVRGRKFGPGLRCLAAYGLPAMMVVAPWVVRNARVLGTANFKANLGVELMVGNNSEADGAFYPAYNARQRALYAEQGEAEYAAYAMSQARVWIGKNPGTFASLCLLRARLFWLGWSPFEGEPLRRGTARTRDVQGWVKWGTHFLTGLLAILGVFVWRDERGAAVIVRGILVLFPLVYYVTHVLDRYRVPVEPFVVLAGTAGLLWLVDWIRAARKSGAEESAC